MEADVAKGRRDWAFSERDKVGRPANFPDEIFIRELFVSSFQVVIIRSGGSS